MIYRIKQFIQGFSAEINNKDIEFLQNFLNKNEYNLFLKLRISEQRHCLNVAYGCYKDMPNNTELIRAAILHDIGKIGSNLTLINKSFVVIVMSLNIKDSFLPTFLKRALYYKREHAQLGYELLKNIVVDEKTLLLIKNHHCPKNYKIPEMNVLVYYDNMN